MKLKGGNIMNIDKRKASKDIINSLKKGAVDKLRFESAAKVGKKLIGLLKSDVLRER